MRKLLLAMLGIVAFTLCEAQNSWYAGVSVGTQVFNGMNDHKMDFADRLAPVFDVQVGKWINPWLALDANLSFADFKGIYNTPKEDKHFVTDTRYGDDALSLRKQDGWYANFYVDAKFDLNNLFSANGEEQKHHVAPYIGLGFASGLKSDDSCFAPTMHLGLRYSYRINQSFAVTADLSNYWVTKDLESEVCNDHSMHDVYGLRLGISYNF